MQPAKTFPGKRVAADDPRFDRYGWWNGKLEPGEYVLVAPRAMADGSPLEPWMAKHYPIWLACAPNGHEGNITGHEITEHADGSITVSPSILISTTLDGKRVELWHGWLEKGAWRVD